MSEAPDLSLVRERVDADQGHIDVTPPTINDLGHQLPEVQEQSKAGLYVVKRVEAFVSKMVESREKYAEQVKKKTKHEMESKTHSDAMGQYVALFTQLQEAELADANSTMDLCAELRKDVIHPLRRFYGDASTTVKNLSESIKKAEENIKKLEKDCKELNSKAISSWQMLKQLHESKKPDVKKIAKMVTQTQKEFQRCEAKAAETAKAQEAFHKEQIPQSLAVIGQQEQTRLQLLTEVLTLYAQKIDHFKTVLCESTNTFRSVMVNVSGADQYETWVQSMICKYGRAAELETRKVDLPCPPEDLVQDGPYQKSLNKEISTSFAPTIAFRVVQWKHNLVSLPKWRHAAAHDEEKAADTSPWNRQTEGEMAHQEWQRLFGYDVDELGHPILRPELQGEIQIDPNPKSKSDDDEDEEEEEDDVSKEEEDDDSSSYHGEG